MELCLWGRGGGGNVRWRFGNNEKYIYHPLSIQTIPLTRVSLIKPRLHERFFARVGDKIFSHFVASQARDESRVAAALEFLER